MSTQQTPIGHSTDRLASLINIVDFVHAAGWDQSDLAEATIADFRAFWLDLLHWSKIGYDGCTHPVCTSDNVEDAIFFPGVLLNYADVLLSFAFDQDAVCLTAIKAGGVSIHMTRGSMRREVERCAGLLRHMGLKPGDRVGSITRNCGEAIVAALAVSALGGVYASTSPDMGVEAIVDRLGQVEPLFLIANVDPGHHDWSSPARDRVLSVVDRLGSLKALLVLDKGVTISPGPISIYHFNDAFGLPVAQTEWPRLPFNHPLYVMFSSGTTAKPKCLVHGAGGVLLEHIKEHRLHCNMSPSDTLYFHTSCAWMMWNWQLSALASGVRIIAYDGPVDYPLSLWAIVADERATLFGTSPPYLRLCSDAGISPGQALSLGSLHTLLSTGSILYDDQFVWIREHVGNVAIQSISGGSDILGCFVLGHPLAPARDGECQSRSLAMDVRAFGATPANPVGELVCANPFPSRPLEMVSDPKRERFHAAYFTRVPGMWAHGDLISFSSDGGARLYGRTDNVMNIRGVRLSPAEIYSVVLTVPNIDRAAAIQYRPADRPSEPVLMLLVVLHHGALDRMLETTIRRSVRDALSASHVPELIIQVSDLPITHNGKESEVSVSDAVHGRPIRNLDALANPSCLDQLRSVAGEQPHADLKHHSDVGDAHGSLISSLQEIWADILHLEYVGPDDDFFELGGSSLLAARLIAALSVRFSRTFPISFLFRAPTIRKMSFILGADTVVDTGRLVVLRTGNPDRNIVMIHSSTGNVFNLLELIQALHFDGTVYGIDAHLSDASAVSVESLASDYLQLIEGSAASTSFSLVGYSFGGLVAFEMARQLARKGSRLPKVVLIDGLLHASCLPTVARGLYMMRKLTRTLSLSMRAAHERKRIQLREDGEIAQAPEPGMQDIHGVLLRARRKYRPSFFKGSLTYIQPVKPLFDAVPAWRSLTGAEVIVRRTEGDHVTMMQDHATQVARIIEDSLAVHAPRQ